MNAKKVKRNFLAEILTGDLLKLYNDPDVISFYTNNDRRLWKFTKKGYEFTGKILENIEIMNLINKVSSLVDEVLDMTNPVLCVDFPNNEMFTAIIPPVSVNFAFFNITKSKNEENF